jgi:hypothetical protein
LYAILNGDAKHRWFVAESQIDGLEQLGRRGDLDSVTLVVHVLKQK